MLGLLLFSVVPASRSEVASIDYSSCKTVCKCIDNQRPTARCSGAGIDTVPNDLHPNLVSLDLSFNKINYLGSMDHYRQLENLNLAHNSIQSVVDGAFAESGNLVQLDLSHNKIGEVTASDLEGLDQLASLDLSSNQIIKIEGYAFTICSVMQEIDLANNQLISLSPQAFQGAVRAKLRELNLSHNLFKVFPAEALQGMSSLSVLDFSRNPLQRLDSAVFARIGASLIKLNLADCGIHTIGPQAFIGLPDLHYLDLSSNGLSRLPNEAFRHIPNLEELHIGNNKLTSLGKMDFAHLKSLKTLGLNGCHEEKLSLEAGLLQSNWDLETLNITHCGLNARIGEEVSLRHLAQLRRVSFHASGLHSLPANLLPAFDLESLDLTGCELECSCSLIWLKELVTLKPFVVSGASCIDPDGKTVNLRDMNSQLLHCEGAPLSALTILGAVVAIVFAVAIIACAVVMCRKPAPVCGLLHCSRRAYSPKHKIRGSAKFSGKDDIKVIQNRNLGEGRNFIQLPGLDRHQEVETENNSSHSHVYEELPGDFPDVKISEI